VYQRGAAHQRPVARKIASMTAEPTLPRLLPIDELNHLPREQFGPALAPLFEAARSIGEALYAARPYRSYRALLERAAEVVRTLSPEQQVEVINAHPRIGAPPEALRRASLISYREQGYDRDATVDRDAGESVQRQLAELNRAYEARHGFRFVVFVNRRPRSEIVGVMRERLANPREQEIQTALAEMLAIARDRLDSLQP